jgi:hypothetical protein
MCKKNSTLMIYDFIFLHVHILMSFSIEISHLWDKDRKKNKELWNEIDHSCHDIISEDFFLSIERKRNSPSFFFLFSVILLDKSRWNHLTVAFFKNNHCRHRFLFSPLSSSFYSYIFSFNSFSNILSKQCIRWLELLLHIQ